MCTQFAFTALSASQWRDGGSYCKILCTHYRNVPCTKLLQQQGEDFAGKSKWLMLYQKSVGFCFGLFFEFYAHNNPQSTPERDPPYTLHRIFQASPTYLNPLNPRRAELHCCNPLLASQLLLLPKLPHYPRSYSKLPTSKPRTHFCSEEGTGSKRKTKSELQNLSITRALSLAGSIVLCGCVLEAGSGNAIRKDPNSHHVSTFNFYWRNFAKKRNSQLKI